jgi:sugar phosphate isomerase/epimerase
MAISGSAINLSTLLLEKNRANGKGPSLLVSEWIEDAGEAGFAGLEVWINHLLFASRSEWELIRERAGEADLPIAAIAAALPVDGSDKSQRFRDAVIEASDYFRPGNLKLALADMRSEETLGFLKEWSHDVPRDIALLLDGGEGAGAEALSRARAALGGERFQGVLHPFLFAPKELEAALAATGDFAANLAVHAKKGGQRVLLEENAEEHRTIVSLVRGRGFKGTWTLESTKGAGLPGENIEKMFDHAEKDLNFLVEAQAQAARAR